MPQALPTAGRPNGISQVHLLKGKGTHHLQAERNQRHLYLQGKKVSGSDVLRSGADNQEARVDPLKKINIPHETKTRHKQKPLVQKQANTNVRRLI